MAARPDKRMTTARKEALYSAIALRETELDSEEMSLLDFGALTTRDLDSYGKTELKGIRRQKRDLKEATAVLEARGLL